MMGASRMMAIRERAYRLWIAEGQPEGRAEIHWKHAEQEYDAGRAPDAPGSEPGDELAAGQPPPGVPEPKF